MENSISTGTKEFASTHPTTARENDNNYGFRRVLSAGVIDQQPINNDRVNGERGIDERDDAALYDSLPGHQQIDIVEPTIAVPIVRVVFVPHGRRVRGYLSACVISSVEIYSILNLVSCTHSRPCGLKSGKACVTLL